MSHDQIAELLQKMTKLGFEGASITVWVDHRTGLIKASVTARDCGSIRDGMTITDFKEAYLAIASAWNNFKGVYKHKVKR